MCVKCLLNVWLSQPMRSTIQCPCNIVDCTVRGVPPGSQEVAVVTPGQTGVMYGRGVMYVMCQTPWVGCSSLLGAPWSLGVEAWG